MKNFTLVALTLCAMACSKSATVDAPASDGGASDTKLGDTDAPAAHRPQLPQTVSLTAAAPASPSYTIQGCASATRSAGAPNDGDDITEAVHVGATPSGLVVSHKVRHACCLKGAVETTVEGNVVTVHEKLTGSPCRCLCGSGIETNVPLAPGAYDVKVVVEAATQKPREVASQRVTLTATYAADLATMCNSPALSGAAPGSGLSQVGPWLDAHLTNERVRVLLQDMKTKGSIDVLKAEAAKNGITPCPLVD